MTFLKYIFPINPRLFVRLLYGNIWELKKIIKSQTQSKKVERGWKWLLYKSYWDSYGSYVGIGAEFEDIPIFPHGPIGIFISNSARIGKNV